MDVDFLNKMLRNEDFEVVLSLKVWIIYISAVTVDIYLFICEKPLEWKFLTKSCLILKY